MFNLKNIFWAIMGMVCLIVISGLEYDSQIAECVENMDQDTYEYICVRIDNPTHENVWDYYCTHTEECDSVSLMMKEGELW